LAVNQHHTAAGIVNGDLQLPLYDFFISLKLNGFLVTPAQIADSHLVIAQYAGLVANEADLCDYLSPLFANNEEEQVKFHEIFNQNFNKSVTGKLATDSNQQNIAEFLKKHWWKLVLGAVIIAATWLIFRIKDDSAVKLDRLYLRGNYEEIGGTYNDGIIINNKEKLQVYPQTDDRRRDSIYQIKLVTSYDWGDNSGIDSSGTHLYAKKGVYRLLAFVNVYYGAHFKYADTLWEKVKVCDETNKLEVLAWPQSDSVKIGENVRLTAHVDGRKPDSIRWSQGNQWLGSDSIFNRSFSTEGQQQITCTAVYDSAGSPCSLEKRINLVVYDPDKPILNASIYKTANANPVLLKSKVKPWWFFLTGGLFLLSFAGMILFGKWNRKAKKKVALQQDETARRYEELVSGFSGKKPPFDLPFRGKNGLPWSEPGLNEVAWQMRRRIEDEATYLHLQKTIHRSIRSGGFFQPVKVPRTLQSEWLVLIDETNTNNQQVKLFEYLVELLRKQNVFIDKFYYREEPGHCYNVFEPAGISLEKLHEKFPLHILLIFGNAYQLIYKHYPIFDRAYLQVIRRWKYKAIMTPVPVQDWGQKEKNVLSEELPVIPVDVYGQLLLMQRLFSGESIGVADLNEFRDKYYRVAPVDFEEIDDLYTYCNYAAWARMPGDDQASNILFQWIAALALYPRIRWEIIIATGKTILEKYGKSDELNFTNLLRIARIKWMSEGRFPDYTRLELLKKLKIDNEVIGRKTILALLNEIPDQEINADHFVYEEKQVQRIINEFNLFAYDPVEYASYEGSKEIFERLWKEKKILDAPAKVYLKNEEKEWRTLVNKPSDKNGEETAKDNVPLEEYFDEPREDSAGLKKWKLWVGFAISILFLGSLLGLIFLTIVNFLNTNYFATFTYKKELLQKVAFVFKDSSYAKGIYETSIRIDTTQINLVKDTGVSLIVPFDDSAKRITVTVNGQAVFDSSMHIDHDGYTVSLKVAPKYNNIKATLYLSSTCTGAIYDYKSNISNADPNIVITDSLINDYADNYSNNYNQQGKGCPNQVSYGARVNISLINIIIENFRKSGVELKINPKPVYGIADNEIAIYYADQALVEKKPAHDPKKEPALDFNKEPASDPNKEPVSDPNKEPVSDPNKEPASDPKKEAASYPKKDEEIDSLFKHYTDEGKRHSTTKNFNAAEQNFTEAISVKPNDETGYLYRGNVRYNQANYYGAIADFNKVLSINPNNALAYYNRGNVRFDLNDYKAAIEDYNEAIRLNSGYTDAYNNRGIAKYRQKDYKGAIKDHNNALKVDPNNASAYYYRAIAKAAMGKADDACNDFRTSCDLNKKEACTEFNKRCKL